MLILSNNPFPFATVNDALQQLTELQPVVTVLGHSCVHAQEVLGDLPRFRLRGCELVTPELFHSQHLVLTLGRGVLEAMSCMRPVIVMDYLGSDGIVTGKTIHEIKLHNFSGRRYQMQWSGKQLAATIRWTFKGDRAQRIAEENRKSVLRSFSLCGMVDQLLAIYRSNTNRSQ